MRHASRNARGYTLIEIVLVITLSAVLTGIAVAGIASLFRLDHATRGHRRGQAALAEFGWLARADVHRAVGCRWDAETGVLRLELPRGDAVEYRGQRGPWVRVAIHAGEEESPRGLAMTDAFKLECEPADAERGELVRLRAANRAPEERARARRPSGCCCWT